jgi:rubrerythrin
MFTAHDIIDIAIQLEKNGEKTYRNAANCASDRELKKLLDWVADEERNHAQWFCNVKNRLVKGEDHHLISEMSRALVEDVIKGQAFSLEEIDFSTLDTPEKMIHTFVGFETDTITFYELIASFVDDPAVDSQLEQIIAEEKKHIAQFRGLLKTLERKTQTHGKVA